MPNKEFDSGFFSLERESEAAIRGAINGTFYVTFSKIESMFKQKKKIKKCGVECVGEEKLVMLEKTETNIKGGWTWNQCKNYTERHSNSLFSIFAIEHSFFRAFVKHSQRKSF